MGKKRSKDAKQSLDKIIGTNIMVQRQLRKVRRDDFARILDLTPSHLGLIERGERGATPVTLERIVRNFGITIDSLFDEHGRSEEKEDNQGIYYKKVSSLIADLSDTELKIVSHTIAGILDARDVSIEA